MTYSEMTHENWNKYFEKMTTSQMQEALMDKSLITALINENVENSYPSINTLLQKARELGVTDSRYFILFTSGYVADVLSERLEEKKSYGKWDYEEKKFELLVHLPTEIQWIFTTEKYTNIMAKVSKETVRSIILGTKEDIHEEIFNSLQRNIDKIKSSINYKQITLENLKNQEEQNQSEIQTLQTEIRNEELALDQAQTNVNNVIIYSSNPNLKSKQEPEKQYGYFTQEQVDEIIRKDYEDKRQTLLDAIKRGRITWKDKDFIREDFINDPLVKEALNNAPSHKPQNNTPSYPTEPVVGFNKETGEYVAYMPSGEIIKGGEELMELRNPSADTKFGIDKQPPKTR